MNFKKLGIFGGVATALVTVAALAQTVLPTVSQVYLTDLFQDLSQGSSSYGNTYVSLKNLRVAIFGANLLHSGTPVLTSCITGGGTIVGNDTAFILTGGSTASTSCVATFAQAYATTPVCTVVSQTAPATSTPAYTVSTTAITITQASSSSLIYDAICAAQPGG